MYDDAPFNEGKFIRLDDGIVRRKRMIMINQSVEGRDKKKWIKLNHNAF